MIGDSQEKDRLAALYANAEVQITDLSRLADSQQKQLLTYSSITTDYKLITAASQSKSNELSLRIGTLQVANDKLTRRVRLLGGISVALAATTGIFYLLR